MSEKQSQSNELTFGERFEFLRDDYLEGRKVSEQEALELLHIAHEMTAWLSFVIDGPPDTIELGAE